MSAYRWKEPVLQPSQFPYGESVSALQKAVRFGEEFFAAWVAVELVHNGFDAAVWRRLAVIACEDLFPDPMALVYVNAARESWISMRRVENKRPIMPPLNILVAAVLRLCRYGSPVSVGPRRESDDLAWLIQLRRKEGTSFPMPRYARDGHTKNGKAWLQAQAKAQGVDYYHVLYNQQFYELCGRTCRPASDRKLPNWSIALIQHLNDHYGAGVSLETYLRPTDLDTEEERRALEAKYLPPEGYAVAEPKPEEGSLFEGKGEDDAPNEA